MNWLAAPAPSIFFLSHHTDRLNCALKMRFPPRCWCTHRGGKRIAPRRQDAVWWDRKKIDGAEKAMERQSIQHFLKFFMFSEFGLLRKWIDFIIYSFMFFLNCWILMDFSEACSAPYRRIFEFTLRVPLGCGEFLTIYSKIERGKNFFEVDKIRQKAIFRLLWVENSIFFFRIFGNFELGGLDLVEF